MNVEMDHKLNLGEVYAILHDLQLRIMHERNVTMVFGIYAVNNDDAEVKKLRGEIAEFIRNREHLLSFHALYKDEDAKRIYCDFIVDYELEDWEKTEKEFTEYMGGLYPEYETELTVETEYV